MLLICDCNVNDDSVWVFCVLVWMCYCCLECVCCCLQRLIHCVLIFWYVIAMWIMTGCEYLVCICVKLCYCLECAYCCNNFCKNSLCVDVVACVCNANYDRLWVFVCMLVWMWLFFLYSAFLCILFSLHARTNISTTLSPKHTNILTLFSLFTCAPRFNSISTTDTWPENAAFIRAVLPFWMHKQKHTVSLSLKTITYINTFQTATHSH